MIDASYIKPVFTLNNGNLMQYMVDTVNRVKPDFLVCRGISGLAMTAPLSYVSKVPYCIVRKSDDSHSMYPVEGYYPDTDKASYLIIDDFIASGATIRTVIDILKDRPGYRYSECVGVLLYKPESNWGRPDDIYNVPIYYPDGIENDHYGDYLKIKQYLKNDGFSIKDYSHWQQKVWAFWQAKENCNETNH